MILIILLTKTDISLSGYHILENCLLFHIQIGWSVYALLVHEKQRAKRVNFMKNKNYKKTDNELRSEYDLSKLQGGVRGKYVLRYNEGTNLVLIAPDVAKVFPSDKSVNEALRFLMKIAKTQIKQRVNRV